MNVQITLNTFEDDGYPFDHFPKEDRKFLEGRFLVWGYSDLDEPRAYMTAHPVRYNGRDKNWITFGTRINIPESEIKYWAIMPDFYPHEEMKVSKHIAVIDTESTDLTVVSERIKNMSQEEARAWIEKICPPIPKRTPESVYKVIRHLEEFGTVNNQSMPYNPEEYPFTEDEFNEAFRFLDHRNNKRMTISDYFSTERKYFVVNDEFKFVTEITNGQGTLIKFISFESLSEDKWEKWEEGLVYHIP